MNVPDGMTLVCETCGWRPDGEISTGVAAHFETEHHSPDIRLELVVVDTPKRIQRKRARGWRMPEGTTYVGRPTRWGNPFTAQLRRRHGVEFWISSPLRNRLDLAAHHTVEADAISECVERFRAEAARPSWQDRVAELAGRDLACWCDLDQPCHADVLLELANTT